MQRILLAVSDRMVNCSAFGFQNASSSTAAAAGTVSVLYCASRAALLRGQLCVRLRHALKSCRSAGTDQRQFLLFRSHKLINIRLFGLGAVTVKRRRLISDHVSLDTASMWSYIVLSRLISIRQQSMGIQLVHLKGNRGALEAFMVLVRCKNYKTQCWEQ